MLSQGKFALVSPEDYEFIMKWKWCFNGKYAVRIDGRKTVWMHRVIAERMGLKIDDKEVDHRNHNGIDNRRENLRSATHADNQHNRPLSKRNTSGFKGVSWNKHRKKWVAHIKFNRKKIHLGYFTNKRKAAREYNRAAIKYFGKFAYLNPV